MIVTIFLFFGSLDAFDGNCAKYENFVVLNGVEIANTDELGILRIESGRACLEKCLGTDTCLGLFEFHYSCEKTIFEWK